MLNTFSKYNLQTAVINIGVVLLFVVCMSIGLTASAQAAEIGTVIVDNADVRVEAKKLPAIVDRTTIKHRIELTWTLKDTDISHIQTLSEYEMYKDKTQSFAYTLSNPSVVREITIEPGVNIGEYFLKKAKAVLEVAQEPNKSGEYNLSLNSITYIKKDDSTGTRIDTRVIVPVKFESKITNFVATDAAVSSSFDSVTVSYPKTSDPVIKVEASFMLGKDKITKDCKNVVIGEVGLGLSLDNKKIFGSSCISGLQKKNTSFAVPVPRVGTGGQYYTVNLYDLNGNIKYRKVLVLENDNSYEALDIQSIKYLGTDYSMQRKYPSPLIDAEGRNGFSHLYTIFMKDGSKRDLRYLEKVGNPDIVDPRFIGEQKELLKKLNEARRQPSFSKASVRLVEVSDRLTTNEIGYDLAKSFSIELINGRKFNIDVFLNDLQRFKNVLNTIGFTGTVNEVIEFHLTKVGEPTTMEERVKELRDQLSVFNRDTPTSSAALEIGSVVNVTDNLRVRRTPSLTGAYIGMQPTGAQGKVVEGPLRAEGYTWFKVDYESGVDGWNAAGWLKKMTNFEGEKEAFKTCVYKGKNYRDGSVFNMPLLSTDFDSNYEAEYKCTAGVWILRTGGNVYLFTDTESITKQTIDPDALKNNDEYTLYKIALKNNAIKYEVKILKKMSPSVRDAEFRKTGYVGSINNLINSAREIGTINQANQLDKIVEPKLDEVIEVTDEIKKVATSTSPIVTPTPKPPVVTPAPKPTPIPPVAATTYTLTDISAVTKKAVDPSKTAIDDEYTFYTITLKNKKTYSVKVFGNQQTSVRDANFKKTGYTGDVAKLLAMAKLVSTTPAPTSIPIKSSTASTTPSPVVKGAATDMYTQISVTLSNIATLLAEQK